SLEVILTSHLDSDECRPFFLVGLLDVQFFKFWALKESFAKMLGTGIFKEIKSISFAGHIKTKFCLHVQERKYFFECFDNQEYVISVCSAKKRNSAIKQVCWCEVLQFYNDLGV
ncbi:MAG: 4'-phosphopantetheinyl transferase superfamily protein, partial [Oscillospiraceae bacterium]